MLSILMNEDWRRSHRLKVEEKTKEKAARPSNNLILSPLERLPKIEMRRDVCVYININIQHHCTRDSKKLRKENGHLGWARFSAPQHIEKTTTAREKKKRPLAFFLGLLSSKITVGRAHHYIQWTAADKDIWRFKSHRSSLNDKIHLQPLRHKFEPKCNQENIKTMNKQRKGHATAACCHQILLG